MTKKLSSDQAAKVHQGLCPDCNAQLLTGPHGGGALNVKCKACAAKFWLCPGLPAFGAERI